MCAGVLVLSGCGDRQSSLAPASPQARDIAELWWWMMGAAWVGLGVIVALLVLSWTRRRRRGLGADRDGLKPGERPSVAVVLGAGVALPVVLLATLFVVSDLFVIRTTEAPAANATRLTVEVTGHQFWWEIRYPGTEAVTANELHIPVRTPVRLEVRTADVIHSFWVPPLNRKIDAIPGRTNEIELYADRAGRYRGSCAEFCGVQHAHMGLWVFADPPGAFRRWLAEQARPAAPAGAGETLFASAGCDSCHTIRGTEAQGYVGPDLTHVGSRTTLAALTIPNTADDLAGWIRDPQQAKPGNQMPGNDLPPDELRALVAYLEGLK